ncbi:hypothetical protein CICLE_v10033795mg [Citrus x clementina]|uniref:FAR1 domain-containing protein n=1 Tax=Citrus clementina TaxID=85681 RepID=V4TIT0_CITCL|nr:hypothetical protein CICLE_v10033795mg [Citrus x clementina]
MVDDEKDISNEPNAEEIIEPKIGMVFDTTQDLFEFYKMYAKIMGFEIIKRTSSKGDDGELKYVTFSYSRSAIRSKGRSPYKRRQSKVEQIIKRKKQKKTTKGSQMISSETQRYGLENNTTHAMVTSDNPMQHREHFSLCNLLTVCSMNCNLALKINADN